jgi:cell division protein FtsL
VSTIAYAQSKRVQNLHLTRERDRRRGRELASYLLLGLPVACALLVYAALHVETVRVGYAREARVRQAAKLTEENRRLRAELAQASAPERVSAVAGRKGLRPPLPGQIQFVEGPRPGSPPSPAPIPREP